MSPCCAVDTTVGPAQDPRPSPEGPSTRDHPCCLFRTTGSAHEWPLLTRFWFWWLQVKDRSQRAKKAFNFVAQGTYIRQVRLPLFLLTHPHTLAQPSLPRHIYHNRARCTDFCTAVAAPCVGRRQAENMRNRERSKILAGFTSGRNPNAYSRDDIYHVDEDQAP